MQWTGLLKDVEMQETGMVGSVWRGVKTEEWGG